VAVVSGLKEGYGLIIESAELSAMLGILWRVVWDAAKPA